MAGPVEYPRNPHRPSHGCLAERFAEADRRRPFRLAPFQTARRERWRTKIIRSASAMDETTFVPSTRRQTSCR